MAVAAVVASAIGAATSQKSRNLARGGLTRPPVDPASLMSQLRSRH